MKSQSELELLKVIAVDRIEESGVKHLAVAVSGSVESIIVLIAAIQVLGKENVLAITADAGYTDSKLISLVEKTCDSEGVEHQTIPVMLYEEQIIDLTDSITETEYYKTEILNEMLHEIWILGFDKLACGCTEDTVHINGNRVFLENDSVICPFLSENSVETAE